MLDIYIETVPDQPKLDEMLPGVKQTHLLPIKARSRRRAAARLRGPGQSSRALM